MFRYGRKSDYGAAVPPDAGTKVYQNLFLNEHLPRFATVHSRVLEVGANRAFQRLINLEVAERWVADPYDGLAGRGQSAVPPHPPEITISRCAIGVNSDALPSGYFDLVFSSSVLEHVGQRAANFDCEYVENPPRVQELPRQRLCEELFRITKLGGVNIHTIDHAVRNVTFTRNFLAAGFTFLEDDPPFTVADLLSDPDVIRQTRLWGDPSKPVPNPHLHSVLILGFRKATELPPPRPTSLGVGQKIGIRLRRAIEILKGNA